MRESLRCPPTLPSAARSAARREPAAPRAPAASPTALGASASPSGQLGLPVESRRRLARRQPRRRRLARRHHPPGSSVCLWRAGGALRAGIFSGGAYPRASAARWVLTRWAWRRRPGGHASGWARSLSGSSTFGAKGGPWGTRPQLYDCWPLSVHMSTYQPNGVGLPSVLVSHVRTINTTPTRTRTRTRTTRPVLPSFPWEAMLHHSANCPVCLFRSPTFIPFLNFPIATDGVFPRKPQVNDGLCVVFGVGQAWFITVLVRFGVLPPVCPPGTPA